MKSGLESLRSTYLVSQTEVANKFKLSVKPGFLDFVHTHLFYGQSGTHKFPEKRNEECTNGQKE